MTFRQLKVSPAYVGDFSDISKVFSEAMTQLRGLNILAGIIATPEEYKEITGEVIDDIESFKFDQLDALSDYKELSNWRELKDFCFGGYSYIGSIARIAENFLNLKIRLDSLVNQADDAFVPLDDKELKILRYNITECLGNISLFLYYQFEFNRYSDDTDFDNVDVITDVYNFCAEDSISLRDLYLEIKSSVDKYIPRMPVFDEYPELEDVFYNVAGMYVSDYYALESNLTIDDVKEVVNASSFEEIESLIKAIEAR